MKAIKNRFLLVIFGPTSVGKTDFAFTIARGIPAEIVNMDVGQLYVPLAIGTAKPDWRASSVPHHLFDIINEPRNFTTIEYRTKLLDTLEGIWQRGKIPIVVGGSGFYLRSIFFPPRANTAEIDVEGLYPSGTNFWQKLYEIDPDRAVQIDEHDMYRIKRALEIWHGTGKLPSSFVSTYHPPADFLLIMLTRERKELYERINARVHAMIQQGWLDEVAPLRDTAWEEFMQQKKLIGYNELLDYFSKKNGKENDLPRFVSRIQKRTRNYAKRQRTFWKMLEREFKTVASDQQQAVGCLETVNLTLVNLNLYIKELLDRLSVIGY